MSIILGIDPGSRVTGFGVIQADGDQLTHINHGVILLDEKLSFIQRLQDLGESLIELLAKYKPESVVVEKIFLGKNADSAFKLGHARGVILYESQKAGCQTAEYATRVIKQGITGHGGASKEDVQAVLCRMLKLKAVSRLDASDALALAVFHAFHLQRKSVR